MPNEGKQSLICVSLYDLRKGCLALCLFVSFYRLSVSLHDHCIPHNNTNYNPILIQNIAF